MSSRSSRRGGAGVATRAFFFFGLAPARSSSSLLAGLAAPLFLAFGALSRAPPSLVERAPRFHGLVEGEARLVLMSTSSPKRATISRPDAETSRRRCDLRALGELRRRHVGLQVVVDDASSTLHTFAPALFSLAPRVSASCSAVMLRLPRETWARAGRSRGAAAKTARRECSVFSARRARIRARRSDSVRKRSWRARRRCACFEAARVSLRVRKAGPSSGSHKPSSNERGPPPASRSDSKPPTTTRRRRGKAHRGRVGRDGPNPDAVGRATDGTYSPRTEIGSSIAFFTPPFSKSPAWSIFGKMTSPMTLPSPNRRMSGSSVKPTAKGNAKDVKALT